MLECIAGKYVKGKGLDIRVKTDDPNALSVGAVVNQGEKSWVIAKVGDVKEIETGVFRVDLDLEGEGGAILEPGQVDPASGEMTL
jgi:hypothetical protein